MGDYDCENWEWKTYNVTIDDDPHLSHFKMGPNEFKRVKAMLEEMGLPPEDYFEIETPAQRAERELAEFYAKDNTVGQF